MVMGVGGWVAEGAGEAGVQWKGLREGEGLRLSVQGLEVLMQNDIEGFVGTRSRFFMAIILGAFEGNVTFSVHTRR